MPERRRSDSAGSTARRTAAVRPVTDLARLKTRLLETGPAVYVADLSGRILYANAAMTALLDLPADRRDGGGQAQLKTLIALEILPDLTRARDPLVRRDSLIGAAGPVNLQSTHRVLSDESGQPAAIGGLFAESDLQHTGRQLAQRAIERFDDIARLVGDWIWETDRDFNITYVTNRVSNVLGLLPLELQGRNLFDIGRFRSTPQASREGVLARDTRQPFRDRLFEMPAKDGSTRLFLISGIPVFDRASGAFEGFRGSARDITEQTRAESAASRFEQRLEEALESMSEGFALLDEHHRLIVANRRLRELLPPIGARLVPGADLGGLYRSLAETGFVHPSDRDGFALLCRGEAEAGRPQLVTLQSGIILQILVYATVSGGTVLIHSDVSELVDREQKLLIAKDEAEQANHAKSRFFASISHELRTPLNAIIGFSDVIMSERLGSIGTERYREYARDIHDSGQHLLALINDILDAAKAEAGRLEIASEPTDLDDLFAASLRLVEVQAAEAGIDIALSCPKIRLDIDPRRMRQVLLNLLSNAIKFTPDGGEVALSAELDSAGRCLILVEDTGIGMAEEEIPQALAPFVQIENVFTRRHEGTGLGLSIVGAIVRLHGGELAIDSQVGRGTRVSVLLPAERVLEGSARLPRTA